MTNVLHLTGSPTSKFYADLSRVYAGDCLAAIGGKVLIAHLSPGGQWCFPDELSDECITAATQISLGKAIERIEQSRVDAVIPQMFCPAGMTHYRSLIETLGIPMVGNPSLAMTLAADKALSRMVAQAAGITIPDGVCVDGRSRPDFPVPAIVKPATADNSQGVSLVDNAADYPSAIATALQFSDRAIVERYIPLGREVRCGVLQRNGKLVGLPLQEYRVGQDKRIRDTASKLTTSANGGLDLTSKQRSVDDQPGSWMVSGDDPIVAAVTEASRRCFDAFQCRDYGLFDFRIDPDGKAFFLEAGLYCSFAPNSIISMMVAATGEPLVEFYESMVGQAIRRGGRDRGSHTNTGAYGLLASDC